MASPTGTDMMRPVRRTSSPSLMPAIFAQQHGADLVFFQVQRDAGNAALELDQLAGHDVFQAVNAGDTVAHRDHRAGLGDVDRLLVILDFLAQHARDFICPNLSHKFLLLQRSLTRFPALPATFPIARARCRRRRSSRRAPPRPPISAGSVENLSFAFLPARRESCASRARPLRIRSASCALRTSAAHKPQPLVEQHLERFDDRRRIRERGDDRSPRTGNCAPAAAASSGAVRTSSAR